MEPGDFERAEKMLAEKQEIRKEHRQRKNSYSMRSRL
jgi:hypothetical protein